MSGESFDALLARARGVPIETEIERQGIKLRGRIARCGPCPRCGGTDRFGVNTKKVLWNCRGCGVGGDVIEFVEHLDQVSFLSLGPPIRLGVTPAPPCSHVEGGR
jgi:DNA primase